MLKLCIDGQELTISWKKYWGLLKDLVVLFNNQESSSCQLLFSFLTNICNLLPILYSCHFVCCNFSVTVYLFFKWKNCVCGIQFLKIVNIIILNVIYSYHLLYIVAWDKIICYKCIINLVKQSFSFGEWIELWCVKIHPFISHFMMLRYSLQFTQLCLINTFFSTLMALCVCVVIVVNTVLRMHSQL